MNDNEKPQFPENYSRLEQYVPGAPMDFVKLKSRRVTNWDAISLGILSFLWTLVTFVFGGFAGYELAKLILG